MYTKFIVRKIMTDKCHKQKDEFSFSPQYFFPKISVDSGISSNQATTPKMLKLVNSSK